MIINSEPSQSSGISAGVPLNVAPPPLPIIPPRMSIAPKSAPPVPVKIAGKAPPPMPQPKLSISGSQAHTTVAPSASAANADKSGFLSELINIHWKPASGHQAGGRSRKSPPSENDQFLKPFAVVASSNLDRLVRENPLPDVLLGSSDDSSVFDPRECNESVPPVKKEMIKQYFSKKQNTKFDNTSMNQSMMTREEGVGMKTGLERERVKLLALALGGTITSRTNRRAIFRQYREAIARCDYQILTTDIMCPLLQLLKGVSDEELSVSLNYVKSELSNSQLPEALVLEGFEEPDVFLFEMSKVPEVKIRLECMIFERTFDDLFQLTMNSLNIIYSGLEVIAKNCRKIATLFQLILKTGNLLNEGSKLGSNQGSFCLATLAKLTEVKSSIDAKLDVLHFILSHIAPEDAVLFSDEEIVKLKNATNLRCYRVRDEVKDLLDSIVAVTEIVNHPVPSAEEEDDRFTLRMSQFAQRIKGTDQWLSKYAFNVFASYKHISSFFEDTKAVYPPPKEKSPDQFDIIELFAWFGGVVKAHEKEIKKKGLRARISGAVLVPISVVEKPTSSVVLQTIISSPSPVHPVVKPGTADPSYVLEPHTIGGSKLLVQSADKQSLPPSFTREQLQSSLSTLGSPTAPPLVAIINRGGTRGDLTASKPKLSPIISPVIDIMVTPAVSPPSSPKAGAGEASLKPLPFASIEGSHRTLSVKELAGGTVTKTAGALPPVRKQHLLITPQGNNRTSRPGVTVSVLASGEAEAKKEDENISFFATAKAYPSRNEEFYPNYAVLNSRQSLSNTISRVAMLLSPTKEDGGIYQGTRRRLPSLTSDIPEKIG